MKIIGSVKEDLAVEKRISITPETIKKFIDLKFSVCVEKNYAEHLGVNDELYKKNGANINNSKKEVYEKSDIILKVNCPSSEQINTIKNKSILIGQFDAFSNKEEINKMVKKGIKIFSLNLLPRITRAQSMDVLSSQANLAGYKAVIDSFSYFQKAIPMMMTAAGTIPAARVLIVGAGGLGCPAIDYLSRAGVGNIGIIDHDKVNISNIHRQSLYNSRDIGKFKVSVIKNKIAFGLPDETVLIS